MPTDRSPFANSAELSGSVVYAPVRAHLPFGRPKETTVTGGLRRTGVVTWWALDGPINTEAFLIYVTRVLVPEPSPAQPTWS